MKNPKHFLQHGMTLIEISVVLLVLIALAGIAMPYFGNIGASAMCQATDATLQSVRQAIMGSTAGAGFYGDLLGELPRDKGVTDSYSLNYLLSRDNGLDDDGDSNLPSSDGKTNVDPDDEWLAFNSNSGVGWHGAYLMSGGKLSAVTAGELDDSFDKYDAITNPNGKAHINHRDTSINQVFDAWGRPIILQVPATCSLSTNRLDCARLVSAGAGNGSAAAEATIDTPKDDDTATARNDDRVLFLKISDPKAGGNTPCDSM